MVMMITTALYMCAFCSVLTLLEPSRTSFNRRNSSVEITALGLVLECSVEREQIIHSIITGALTSY